MDLRGKTYWIVGASEGLGRALAEELDRRGTRLVLSARNGERLQSLAQTLTQDAKTVTIDVADTNSVKQAYADVGPIDGVIYVAGLYEPMAAQDWKAETVEAICDVNFMGAVRVLGQAVPEFTKADAGHIVLIGSLSGYRGLPGATGYGASKAALMHMAESLQADLWSTGVKVQLFNPGFIRTRLTDKNQFSMPFIVEPEKAADIIANGMERNAFRLDFPWLFSKFFRITRLLPQFVFQSLFAR